MAEESEQGGEQRPLNYRSGRDEADPFVEGVKGVVKIVAGFILGAIGIIILGVFSTGLAESNREFQFHSVPLGVAYYLAAVGGVVACAWGLWRAPRRWFLAGLLLGGGLACLMEGACFTSA